jgi:hypothetical protein
VLIRVSSLLTYFAGKGIADQDRNILSNQILILGFLRSVSGFLVKGPPPTLGSLKKKGKTREEKDDTDVDSDQEGGSREQTGPSRGTVIITLRNVAPYTECKWVWITSVSKCHLRLQFQGIFVVWRRNRLLPRQRG